MLRVFELIGRQVQALGVADAEQFDAASALLNYILGVGRQNAANAQAVTPGTTRADFFESAWGHLDPAEYPFLRHVTKQLMTHDDRAQFLAGVNLILKGIKG
ncbi:TetR/AcrR family transcriptional regulator C-terminal domain-containing protein [Paractinoplanes durhamensis]|uniref:TetR/AcrR family transcriptional regulator C-terminal domain-containing protein n=1 Tax=Paractinoplanes durhamensis TaxID=113563 RepID=UPI003629181F